LSIGLGRAGLWGAGDRHCCRITEAGMDAARADVGSWSMGREPGGQGQ